MSHPPEVTAQLGCAIRTVCVKRLVQHRAQYRTEASVDRLTIRVPSDDSYDAGHGWEGLVFGRSSDVCRLGGARMGDWQVRFRSSPHGPPQHLGHCPRLAIPAEVFTSMGHALLLEVRQKRSVAGQTFENALHLA